jgi:hypothetical protein
MNNILTVHTAFTKSETALSLASGWRPRLRGDALWPVQCLKRQQMRHLRKPLSSHSVGMRKCG